MDTKRYGIGINDMRCVCVFFIFFFFFFFIGVSGVGGGGWGVGVWHVICAEAGYEVLERTSCDLILYVSSQ